MTTLGDKLVGIMFDFVISVRYSVFNQAACWSMLCYILQALASLLLLLLQMTATPCLLLVVLTLVGLAAVRGTIMQQKMTANFSDRQITFQVGEAGLRQAEIEVQGVQPSAPPARPSLPATIRDCSPKATTVIKCPANPLTDSTLPPANIKTVAPTSFNAGSLASGPPQYVIEYMGNFSGPTPSVLDLGSKGRTYSCNDSPTSPSKNPCADFYRITVRSGPADGTDRSTVVLQSVYRR